MKAVTLIIGLAMAFGAQAENGELQDISNFRQYSESFASSGQPSETQLATIREAGFERIVYIAWSDHEKSLPNEDRLVKSLGMEYLHIPVNWDNPTLSDFYLFAGAMQRAPARKTLLHCQVNFRASAFSFLYRVIYGGVPLAEAKRDMNSVWTPNETWRDFIFAVLQDNGVSPHCENCDWTTEEH
jgi:protein tyrosine phosphatase (PTP) superfamily phosphohydrolase (DUF442 family)